MTQGTPFDVVGELKLPVKVTAPRLFIFDFLLLFGSFGIYTPFWLVGQMREIKKIGEESFKPWLWWFVPFIGLTQFWALPSLNRELNRLERKLDLPSWQQRYSVWAASIIILTFLNNYLGRLEETPLTIFLAFYLIHISLWSLLILRIRRIKTHLQSSQDPAVLNKYRWWEWPIVTLGTLIVVSLCLFILIDTTQTSVIKTWVPSSTFVDEETGLMFPVESVVWTQVENEDDSDALFSFVGPDAEFYAHIFEYKERSVNDLAKNRYAEAVDLNNAFDCVETQSFIAGTLNVRAEQRCLFSGVLGVDGAFSTFLETKEQTFELHIIVYSTKSMNSKLISSVRKAAAGFRLK
ncbi:hypothetical protein [Reinekea sp. G2M2-21]|uniref:hypothetical protein n=1 Tax=Reinekea sp. G2M2-21 TaxID=2788942 RepID=UPI0018AA3CEB|nr:hypothetical protein [Reinekea sp. G2M2-21]